MIYFYIMDQTLQAMNGNKLECVTGLLIIKCDKKYRGNHVFDFQKCKITTEIHMVKKLDSVYELKACQPMIR